MGQIYLSDDFKMEPLVNNWYGWSFLVAPATFAMFTQHHHVKILESYLSAPDFHRMAVRNPAMRGGPFMDYSGDIDKVRDLLARTKSHLAHVLELADAIAGFSRQLRAGANGFALTDWYGQVPAALRGYVELGYDLHHAASIRFFEGLLYRSRYYDPGLQSLALVRGATDGRPFVLSTPRFAGADEQHLSIAFNSPLVDVLARSRTEGIGRAELDLVCDGGLATGTERDRLRSAFGPVAPRLGRDRNFDGEGTRVRYLGHATMLFETLDVSIITDPVVSYPATGGIDRFDYHDLPDRLDYVLLTHNHQDHVLFETLLQMRHKIGTLVVPRNLAGTLQDPSLAMVLRHLGFKRVVELDEMETLAIPGGEITGLPFLGEHGDLHIQSKLAFHVRLNRSTYLCMADSNNLQDEMYAHVHDLIGDVDQIFIGMECDGAPLSWLYGPLFGAPLDRKMDQSRRLNGSDFQRGFPLVSRFHPKSVYVYAMGQEPWLTYISSIAYTAQSRPIVESDRLIVECRRAGIEAERLFGMKTIHVP